MFYKNLTDAVFRTSSLIVANWVFAEAAGASNRDKLIELEEMADAIGNLFAYFIFNVESPICVKYRPNIRKLRLKF